LVLAKHTYTKAYLRGDTIFAEGDVGGCAYLIDSGRVEIQVDSLDGTKTPVAILGVGDIFGEMAIIDGSPRSASAVALEECEVVEVSKEQLNERVEDADPVVRFLLSILLNRLRETLKGSSDPTKTNLPVEATTTNIINLSDYKSNADVVEKIKLEKSLKNALDENEFTVHYQPIVDVKTNDVAGFEALMRWHNSERGFVRPDIFMGIAEETSLIVPIGHWIIKRTIRDFAKLKQNLKNDKKYKNRMFLSINIAAKQFNDPHLFEILNKTAKYYSIPPEEIKLEITERVLLQGNFVFDWIKKARKKGYSVALDDFGTGYSSLSYLANLEVNNLKIDKSFVEKMVNDPKSRSIVKSLIRMAKDLNLTVIAEGVETKDEWEMLRSFGCTYIQGYYFSKAIPMADVYYLLSGTEKKKAA
jgi:EAL domain-containing protein (putative c-di-GMP-specific phosphodiesterase class I)